MLQACSFNRHTRLACPAYTPRHQNPLHSSALISYIHRYPPLYTLSFGPKTTLRNHIFDIFIRGLTSPEFSHTNLDHFCPLSFNATCLLVSVLIKMPFVRESNHKNRYPSCQPDQRLIHHTPSHSQPDISPKNDLMTQ